MTARRLVRCPVVGRFDRVKVQRGTLVLDRRAGLVYVRPYRSRSTYALDLDTAAELIAWRVAKARAEAERAAKRRKRKR
jgi:hypothetical protein